MFYESILPQVIIAITSFVFGSIFGWTARGFAEKQNVQEANFVLVVVTSVWAASMLVDILNPGYTTSPIVHGLMGAIVGFFYKPFLGRGQK